MAGACLPFSKSLGAFFNPPNVNLVDTKHPKDCDKDLRTPLFTNASLLSYANFNYHKSTVAIKDVLYKADESISNCVLDIPNLPAEICDDTNHHATDESALRYRAYYRISTHENPTSGHDYDAVPLPCVVLFHPGGFQECPSYLTPGLVTICEQLAARGYIAITCEYRTGRKLDNVDTNRVSAQQQLAPYRAIQDGRGAIRSIIKRNNSNTPDNHLQKFTINEDQFFVGGLSAGAITALGIAYYRSQTMMNQVFPVASTSLTVQQALGHMNADYYYGEPGSDLGNPNYWPVIRGVLNCWGGITIPKSFDGTSNPDLGSSESGFFAGTGTGSKINPPIIGFAGTLDEVVYFEDDNTFQNILNSKATAFRNEDFCLNTTGSYKLKDTGINEDLIFVKQCSAQNLYYILKHSSIDRFTELYVDCNMKHGINNLLKDNFGVYKTDSNGDNITTKDDVYTYIAIRAAIFFQTIMQVSPTAAFPEFGFRGKSLFRSRADNVDSTNQRICTQCDNNPVGDTCGPSEDLECD